MARTSGCFLVFALLTPTAGLAQSDPPPKPASDPKAVEAVTVTGAAPDVQTSIDRRSYSIGKDLQAATGSIGDALRNLPSVEVDLQGNLSMRGDPNVTVLVDGKPSGAFNGPARADALQQLPADQIERVEVITNPSAAMNPEGSAGVINLITRKSRGAGVTGAVNATAGSGGLKRAGATFGYNSKTLSVTGYLSGNYQRSKSHWVDERISPGSVPGSVQHNRTITVGRNLSRGPRARLNLGYEPDPKNHFTGELSYNEILQYGHPTNRFESGAPGSVPASVLDRVGHRHFRQTDLGLSAGWKRSFAGDRHDLSIDLIHNISSPANHALWQSLLPAPAPGAADFSVNDATLRNTELKAAYKRPMGGQAELTAGYELRDDKNEYDNLVDRGATAAMLVRDPSVSNVFLFRRRIDAIYGTYERPFGDLTLQAGLRVEAVRTHLNQITSGTVSRADRTSAYPTLHLGYKLDDGRTITASFSKRVQRPYPSLLNPFRIYLGPTDFFQGNPGLKPKETRSFELGYEQKGGPTTYLATLYYRDNRQDFSPVHRDLGSGVFLTTYDNLARSRAAGLELTASGRLSAKLTYNLNGNFSWTQTDASNLGIPKRQTLSGLSGRANLNWQASADDLVQINAFARSRSSSAQGYSVAFSTLNLGWRHKINDRIAATVTAQDVLNSSRHGYILDTAALKETFYIRPVSRSLVIRLDYRFGGDGKAVREPGFEYETGGPSAH